MRPHHCIKRSIASKINPIISETQHSKTLENISGIIQDIGKLASANNRTAISTPHIHILYEAIFAALEYEFPDGIFSGFTLQDFNNR